MEEINRLNFREIIDKKFANLQIEKGVLYVVSTPIGNLADISFRALYVLENVDIIACEDTRVTATLLSKFGIKNRLVSYYSKVEQSKKELILDELKSNQSVALVSDAGTPGISDPGNILISECLKSGIKVISVPGASSIIHALVVSGFEIRNFFFQGFLPQKGREKLYEELRKKKMLLVILESKYRIKKTLCEMKKHFGTKEATVSRELTKIYETIYRGTINEIADSASSIVEKGEFVIVINNI